MELLEVALRVRHIECLTFRNLATAPLLKPFHQPDENRTMRRAFFIPAGVGSAHEHAAETKSAPNRLASARLSIRSLN